MSQTYFPNRQFSAPPTPIESVPMMMMEKQLNAEEVQEAYVQHKEKLLHALDGTKDILVALEEFNKESWVMRYPSFQDATSSSPQRPGSLKRSLSLSFADDPQNKTEVILTQQCRRVSLATIPTVKEEPQGDDTKTQDVSTEEEESSAKPDTDFHVLRLDLNLGPRGSSTSVASLVSHLEKSSIANLLSDRVKVSLEHMDKLRVRVEDKSSKVLVTGDLNSGKSTLVNALLRRDVMPVDQQPCTTAFCEVHDAAENEGKEEVHIVKEGASYSLADKSTYTCAEIEDLEEIISENETSQPVLKVYISDPREPSASLLNNGIADISLIDAPGLNRDSLKTTALFTRQEEIDVVVFVVSAENHFTLSAKEFLTAASKEKAYVFIVVNKYDQIRNKEKCRRRVLEQIKELSPGTYADADDLVHFVDASSVLGPDAHNTSFDTLESALRGFVLMKRSKSKLNPAATYLKKLLSDVELLVSANALLAQSELEAAKADLEKSRPVLDKLRSGQENLDNSLYALEEAGTTTTTRQTKVILNGALEKVGSGELGVKNAPVPMPSYPGLFDIMDYIHNVRHALLASVDEAVKNAEDEARVTTKQGVESMVTLADRHLPEGAERWRRVFMPEAMFARRARSGKDTPSSHSVHALGLGLAQRPELLEASLLDLFDLQYQYAQYFGDERHKKTAEEEDDSLPSALGVASVGIGALTVVGGKALGARGLLEGVLRISELWDNERVRKWAAPVVGVLVVGLTMYFVSELPSAVPRTVGRRIRRSLEAKPSALDGENAEPFFVDRHAARVGRETRKVLRLVSYGQKERHRKAMEESSKVVKGAEEVEKRTKEAIAWFEETHRKTDAVRRDVESVGAL